MQLYLILICSILILPLSVFAEVDNVDAELRTTSIPSASPLSENFDLYGEMSANNRIRDFIHYTKLTKDFAPTSNWMRTYFGVLVSGDTLSSQKNIYNDNYVAPVVGMKIPLREGQIHVLSEVRQVFSQFESSEGKKNQTEARLGIVGGSNQTIRRFESGSRIYNEVYGEAIYSSRLENNIFLNLSDKLGLEKKWDKYWASQFYGEAYGRRDRLGYYYENLQEARLGFAQKLSYSHLNFALSMHLASGTYTDRQYRDPNPYSNPYNESRMLFVFGGQL